MTSGQPEGRFPPGRPRVQGERLGGRPGVLAPRSRRGPVLLGGSQRLLPPVTAALPAASAGLAEAAASMCAPPAGARPWPWRLPPGRRACASAAWAVLPSPEARCTRLPSASPTAALTRPAGVPTASLTSSRLFSGSTHSPHLRPRPWGPLRSSRWSHLARPVWRHRSQRLLAPAPQGQHPARHHGASLLV